MTSGAILRRGLVEQHALALHDFYFFVASLAAHVLVRSSQRERSATFVIEKRWLPLRGIVAIGAGGDPTLGKLFAMRILVALLALSRSRFKIHIHQPRLKVRRFVAIHTSRRAVCPQQRERRLGMVKAGEFAPRFGGVTGLATHRLSAKPFLQHAVFELILVGIVVATRARETFPVIERRSIPGPLDWFLMAISAGNGNVAAGKHEARLLVACQRKRGRPVALQIVALFASIKVRRSRKLAVVLIAVAIRTLLELDLEQRVLPFWDVTLRALQIRVLPL